MRLLKEGVELYEIRSLLGSTRGSGETPLVSRYGNYGLHAKLLVFDRKRIFIGSMNFDQRSKHLNTEIGLIIDSPELAQQTVTRFDHMVRPDNVYVVRWREATAGVPAHLVWDTREDGKDVEYTQEPARSSWQRFDLRFLSWLPIGPGTLRLGKPLLLALIVALSILPAARAAPPPAAQIEINHLLGLIEQSGCEFFRNGTWYDAQRAQAHLRAKYDVLVAQRPDQDGGRFYR